MDIYSASAGWLWGVSLIVLTLTIHATGVVSMALGMTRFRHWLEGSNLGLLYVMPLVIGVIGGTGLLLTVLHGVEARIWAAAYLCLGAFDSRLDAVLFSIGSMTTVGAPGGLVLPQQWQMLGVMEAGNGALLFGISTAYIFGAMQAYWPLLQSHKGYQRKAAPSRTRGHI